MKSEMGITKSKASQYRHTSGALGSQEDEQKTNGSSSLKVS